MPKPTYTNASVRKSVSAAERKQLPHAGPNGSFPLKPSLLKAAWDLAGHAANPAAVRARIKAYAAKHGLTSHLPKTAQVSKATTAAMQGILHDAYHAGDAFMRERVVRAAVKQGVTHLLPPDAHTQLHALGLPHKHASDDGIVPSFDGEDEANPGGGNDPDDNADPMLYHHHVVTKALNPKATSGSISKAWVGDDEVLHIEGWMSTPDRDLEKDITEPEAFKGGPLANYFTDRSAPLSLDHNTTGLPVGHLQKAAILRNGTVLETANHPTDPAEFTHLPTSGSGVWVRGVITEEPAKSAVLKGNVAGMSFIGNFTRYEPLPGGGRRFLRIDPLVESTVAAYPVNTKAAFSTVQKALGIEENMEDDLDLVAMLEEAAKRYATQQAKDEDAAKVAKGVTTEQLADLLAQMETRITALVEDKVQKAIVPERGEGVGRKDVPGSALDPRESDPAAYIIAKAADPDTMTQADKELAGKMTIALLSRGMAYENED